jgi:hypothetical protein
MITQIIWFFSLPVIIFVTYRLALLALKKFEKKN